MPNKLTTSEVRTIIEKLAQYINESQIVPAAAFYRTKMLLALLSKAISIGQAVCALVDAGFPDEAYGLLRTLVETFFIVRYISNTDSEARASRYAEYFGKVHEQYGVLIERFFPKEGLTPPEYHEEVMGWAENYVSGHQWFESSGAVRTMAFEEDSFEFDANGLPIKQDFDYKVIYWDTSQFVHSSVISLGAHLCPPGEAFRVRGGPLRKSRRSDYSLFNVVVFLRKTVVSVYRGMRDDLPEDILEEMLQLLRSYTCHA